MVQSSLTNWLTKPAPTTQNNITISDRADKSIADESPNIENGDSPELNNQPAFSKNTLDSEKKATSKRDLPPNVELRACTKDDIAALKRLTGLLLPVPYPDRFYREIIEDEVVNSITLLAFWHDNVSTNNDQTAKTNNEKGKLVGAASERLVGAIRCRLLAYPPTPTTITRPTEKANIPMLYLSSLVLLSPYRHHGIAAHMLNVLMRRAVEDYGIGSVGAHVWEANAEGLEWYLKRGFVEVGREKDYYRRLQPAGAFLMKRDVGVMDLI